MILIEHYPIPDAIQHATLYPTYLLSCLSSPGTLGSPGAGRGGSQPAKISWGNHQNIDDFAVNGVPISHIYQVFLVKWW